jgi:hypothetical protein
LKTTLELWKRFWRLSNFGRMIAFQSIGALIAIKVGLFLFGLRPWKHKMATIASAVTPPPSPAIGPEHVATAQEIAQIVSLAARNLFFSSNCLDQALALSWLLRRRGIVAELRFGARKVGDRLEAHAWVELDGTVLGDPDELHLDFTPFERPLGLRKTQIH